MCHKTNFKKYKAPGVEPHYRNKHLIYKHCFVTCWVWKINSIMINPTRFSFSHVRGVTKPTLRNVQALELNFIAHLGVFIKVTLYSVWGGGGGNFAKKNERGRACRTSRIDLLYTIFFFAQLPTHQYTHFNRKAPDCFLEYLLNYTQYMLFGLLLLCWNPRIDT